MPKIRFESSDNGCTIKVITNDIDRVIKVTLHLLQRCDRRVFKIKISNLSEKISDFPQILLNFYA